MSSDHHGHDHHGPHHHHHHHGPDDGSVRNLGWAFWLNLGFALIELVGGYFTGSLAVMSDALHDFGDALSFGVGYFLQRKSRQGPSETFSYGLRRLSLLSAFISGVVITVGAVIIAIAAVQGFNEPRTPHGPGMAALALLGIAVNGFAAWRMGLGKSHNEKILRWHLIEDILGWVAVLVGGGFIWAFGWTWLDPVLALGIAIFVSVNVLRHLSSTVGLFLQANPDPEGLRQFRDHARKMPNIIELHDVHFWSLDGVHHVLSLHAVLRDLTQAEAGKEELRRLSKHLGNCHVTVEVEAAGEHCHDDCEHEAP